MSDIDRRALVGLGVMAAFPTVATGRAEAQPHALSQGLEIAPGVRLVELGKRASMLAGYKNLSMRDIVYQPGAKSSTPSMVNDMVCHCTQGALRIKQVPGMEFVARRATYGAARKGARRKGKHRRRRRHHARHRSGTVMNRLGDVPQLSLPVLWQA